ncbi:MAG: hypothetical protein U0163_12100 [Gemmatimonadaceae bacterium]
MDELDRVYRRLVQNIRAAFPELLTRPFEVAKIYQQIIPYRHNRRELGFETSEDYELTLTQLLSGARGLLMGDDEMQRALRGELESPNPDLSAYRAFATSMVSLAPEALRALDAQPAMRPTPTTSDLPVAASRSAADQARLASRATEEMAGQARCRHATHECAWPHVAAAWSTGAARAGSRTGRHRESGLVGPSCQYCSDNCRRQEGGFLPALRTGSHGQALPCVQHRTRRRMEVLHHVRTWSGVTQRRGREPGVVVRVCRGS